MTIVPFRPAGEKGDELGAFAYLDEPHNDGFGINLRVLNFLEVYGEHVWHEPIAVHHESIGQGSWDGLFSNLPFAAVPSASPLGPVSPKGFVHTPFVNIGVVHVIPFVESGEYVTTEEVAIPGETNGYGVASLFVAGAFFDEPGYVVVCADSAPPEGALSRCKALLLQPDH